MKITLLAGAIALASIPVVAKDKVVPITEADAAALKGKTIAVTFHEAVDFTAGTAGKASFGILGAFAMIKAGNDLVRENGIADPAIVVRQQLGEVLRQTHGAQVQGVDSAPTNAKKPKELAAAHPQADYVLDVRSRNWLFAYYPTDWNNYLVMYTVTTQLVAKDGRQVSRGVCTVSSKASKTPPTHEQLLADGAKLIKDYTTAMGWNCVQTLATNQFMVPLEKFTGVPQPYAELIASFTPTGQAAVKFEATSQTAPHATSPSQGAGAAVVAATATAGPVTALEPAVPVESVAPPEAPVQPTPIPAEGGG